MTAGAKIEHIIALTEDYTQQLISAKEAWQYNLTAALLSTEKVDTPPYPTDEAFEEVAEAILYRIRGVLDDSTV